MYRPVSLRIKNILSWEDVTFQFHQGKAVIIVGENKDDPGQKGNGSGKSGLTEGVVIALTGSVVRPIKKQEIVRRGCDEGEVELILENEMYGTQLTVWRKLYSGTKSAEYKLLENGVDHHESYSDQNGFNALIWTMLGISKEDFYSFYVLEKTTTPFLLMGDTEKKKVVNRFSGANKVDAALPFVEADVKVKETRVKLIDGQILIIKGKQELLSEQITKEEDKYSEEGKQNQLIAINETLSEHTRRLEEALLANVQTKKEIDAHRKLLKAIVHVDYPKEINEIKNSVNEAGLGIKECNEAINEIAERRSQANEIKAELKNSLAGLIACPKCSHEFTLAHEENFCAHLNRTELVEVETIILPEIEIEYQAQYKLSGEYREIKDNLEKQLKALKIKEDEEEATKKKINRAIDELENNLVKKNRQILNMEDAILIIQKEALQIGLGKSEKIEELTEQLMEHVDGETLMREKLQEAVDDKNTSEVWLTHFKSFKSHLANKSIANIQDYCNLYLQAMGSNIQIIIEGYKMLSNKKLKEEITTLVVRNGIDDASYGSYSGGERGRIDVCVLLAMQQLINVNSSKNGLDLLILDEVMDSVDALGLETIVKSLEGTDRTIMIVSQNDINTLSDSTITITKKNGISSIT